MSEEGKAVMEEVEKEQSYEELTILRRLVMTHIKTERELAEVNNNNNKQHQQNTTITAKHKQSMYNNNYVQSMRTKCVSKPFLVGCSAED